MGISSSAQLAQGQALLQQGRLAEAAAAFRYLLATEPRNSHALHLLGITVGRMGHPQEAVDLITAAVGMLSSNPIMHTNLGNALSELGRHTEALKSYDRAVALKPDLAVAHSARGMLLVRLTRPQEALDSLTRALQLSPNDALVHNSLGVALERLGRNAEALQHFERAIALNARFPEAYHNHGLLLMSLGRHADALSSIDRALALQPGHAAILASRGNALRALERPAEALASYDQSLAIASGDARVHHQRAVALLSLQRYGEALAGLECALALSPDEFGAHLHRGVVLEHLDRHEQALRSFDRVVELNGPSAEVLNNRGAALVMLARPGEALEAFREAIECNPDGVGAYTNAAHVLQALGRFPEALQTFDRALAIEPDHTGSQWGKSLLKLTLGEFEQGWPLYESRLRLENRREQVREFAVPRWSGSQTLTGKNILVHAEQGLGDTVQFSRYIPLLEAQGARVIFELPEDLSKLMVSLRMRGALLTRGEPPPPLDYHYPLLSLPLAFQTQLHTIPGGVPYIAADAAAVADWRARLRALPGLKIGLNWQGHAATEKQPWLRGRSFALSCAAPLARVPGVSLVSLQKGTAAEQRASVEFGSALAQLTDPLNIGADAVMESAALISALDLVVTSDTFFAHLAGALGVPVFVALQTVPDWRWLLDRSDSPWYPTIRLFRQREPGDWAEVFERVAHEVAALVGKRQA
ncbi:MAG: tetratricopeptide repeat protein [Steroidobacteraceae bacterium]